MLLTTFIFRQQSKRYQFKRSVATQVIILYERHGKGKKRQTAKRQASTGTYRHLAQLYAEVGEVQDWSVAEPLLFLYGRVAIELPRQEDYEGSRCAGSDHRAGFVHVQP
jgi:hypothetical protein